MVWLHSINEAPGSYLEDLFLSRLGAAYRSRRPTLQYGSSQNFAKGGTPLPLFIHPHRPPRVFKKHAEPKAWVTHIVWILFLLQDFIQTGAPTDRTPAATCS